MTPVPYLMTCVDGGQVARVAYTTTTPGLLLLPVGDPLHTTVTVDAIGDTCTVQCATGTRWDVVHHEGLAVSGGMLGGAPSYPHALRLARALAEVTDWTQTGDDVTAVPGKAVSGAWYDLGARLEREVRQVLAAVQTAVGELSWASTAPERLALAIAAGWTPQVLADRLLHGIRSTDPNRAVVDRIRRLAPPAPAGHRPAWCGACDPGTRLLARVERGGHLVRCRTCYPASRHSS
ncbi:hypothetical protein ACFY4C_41090 [Actinomadura viridis]|uniref:hypothetical protein n=1 Tax=Actinomadura viridis TaxID=58110 RepID=UPI0036A09670